MGAVDAITNGKIWTVEDLVALLNEQRELSIRGNREATACPQNPDGKPYEDTTWYGSIREAWTLSQWEKLIEGVNEPLTSAMLRPLTCEDFDVYVAAIETVALRVANNVIGNGQPILVAIAKTSGYSTVFCEFANELEVILASWRFYP